MIIQYQKEYLILSWDKGNYNKMKHLILYYKCVYHWYIHNFFTSHKDSFSYNINMLMHNFEKLFFNFLLWFFSHLLKLDWSKIKRINVLQTHVNLLLFIIVFTCLVVYLWSGVFLWTNYIPFRIHHKIHLVKLVELSHCEKSQTYIWSKCFCFLHKLPFLLR